MVNGGYDNMAATASILTRRRRHIIPLYRMMLRYGCPEEIISDQEREVYNCLVDLLEQLTGFQHTVTSAYKHS